MSATSRRQQSRGQTNRPRGSVKRRPGVASLARTLEALLVYSVADDGSAAPDVIPQAIELIAQTYGERPSDTAKRVARKANIATHATPDPSAYMTRAAIFSLTEQ